MASKNYTPDPYQRIFNYRLDEEMFISGGATNNGTVLLNWFCKNFYWIRLSISLSLEKQRQQ